MLDAGPEGTEARELLQGCDDADLIVVAGRSYEYDAADKTQADVLAHYRDSARAHGWRYRTTTASASVSTASTRT